MGSKILMIKPNTPVKTKIVIIHLNIDHEKIYEKLINFINNHILSYIGSISIVCIV